jgi:hypothetical protein
MHDDGTTNSTKATNRLLDFAGFVEFVVAGGA